MFQPCVDGTPCQNSSFWEPRLEMLNPLSTLSVLQSITSPSRATPERCMKDLKMGL